MSGHTGTTYQWTDRQQNMTENSTFLKADYGGSQLIVTVYEDNLVLLRYTIPSIVEIVVSSYLLNVNMLKQNDI